MQQPIEQRGHGGGIAEEPTWYSGTVSSAHRSSSSTSGIPDAARAYRVTSEMLARSVFRSRPGIKQVIGVVARAAFTVALLMPWLAILALLYLRVRRQACPSR